MILAINIRLDESLCTTSDDAILAASPGAASGYAKMIARDVEHGLHFAPRLTMVRRSPLVGGRRSRDRGDHRHRPGVEHHGPCGRSLLLFDQELPMKTVYFKSGDAEWKYELDDVEHEQIIKSIIEDGTDFEEMLDESLEILRDISAIDDEELDEDDQIDQTISVSFIWHYFNNLPEGNGRIEGDVVLIEDDDGSGVSVMAATEVIDDDVSDE
jgi:hypothetical protein